jgi:hypothetical protein
LAEVVVVVDSAGGGGGGGGGIRKCTILIRTLTQKSPNKTRISVMRKRPKRSNISNEFLFF